MANVINLVYFGTSDHSVILLNQLKKSSLLNLKLVITKTDLTVGRNKETVPTPVKKWCLENGIFYKTTESLKRDKEIILDILGKESIKLGLVADFGLMIPKGIIDSIDKGIVNIHFSLLPKLRGAAPVTYTLLQRQTKAGITFLLTTSEMDKGDILMSFEFEITERETDESLYKKLFELAGQKCEGVLLDYFKGNLSPTPQNELDATYCTPSGKFDRTTYITKDDAKIDWKQKSESIEAAIRAFFPWPVAWTSLGELSKQHNFMLKNPNLSELRVKIHKAHLSAAKELVLDEIQLEGKTKCSFEAFKNGYFVKQ
ncbi:MAG: methionyl-tRNA formyltransferase [Patescibacteria group bacterium]